jgi:hypothetical protein
MGVGGYGQIFCQRQNRYQPRMQRSEIRGKISTTDPKSAKGTISNYLLKIAFCKGSAIIISFILQKATISYHSNFLCLSSGKRTMNLK